ncbi:MAG: MerR family transcriptional regulator [Actinomycetota bacterium]
MAGRNPTSPEAAGQAVPVADIEQETGLPREVVRKWESRYGFPRPQRDGNGDRVYPAEQVQQLRLVRRLLGAGMRPAKVVGLDMAALQELAASVPPADTAPGADFAGEVLGALVRQDVAQLAQCLRARLARDGLADFVCATLARLNLAVGEAWLRGDIRVFEEHLYSHAVVDLLYEAVRPITDPAGQPRVLLTTSPGEIHTIGLMMADAVLALEGAHCIRLGAQTPSEELAAAVRDCRADIVALSFSAAHPLRDAAHYLRGLRQSVDPSVEIWVGGAGVERLRRTAGVRVVCHLPEAAQAVRDWRATRG